MPIDFIPDKKIDFTPDGPATATIDFVPDKPLVPLDMSELSWSAEGPGPQSVNVGPRTESMQPKALPSEKKRPYTEELIDAAARGLARVGSSAETAYANIIGLERGPGAWAPSETASQKKARLQDVKKHRKNAEFLWNLSKHPEIAAQNKDLVSKGLNLIGETLPYITATSAAYLATGPLGGFAVGSMVEGNSAYRVALDNNVPPDKAKKIGIGVGLISGAIEAFGGRFAEDLLVKAVSKLHSKLAKGAAIFGIGTVVEALEEGGQEIAQLTGESTYRDVKWDEAVNRTLGSMAGGAFLGGVMKGGGTAIRKGIDMADRPQGGPLASEEMQAIEADIKAEKDRPDTPIQEEVKPEEIPMMPKKVTVTPPPGFEEKVSLPRKKVSEIAKKVPPAAKPKPTKDAIAKLGPSKAAPSERAKQLNELKRLEKKFISLTQAPTPVKNRLKISTLQFLKQQLKTRIITEAEYKNKLQKQIGKEPSKEAPKVDSYTNFALNLERNGAARTPKGIDYKIVQPEPQYAPNEYAVERVIKGDRQTIVGFRGEKFISNAQAVAWARSDAKEKDAEFKAEEEKTLKEIREQPTEPQQKAEAIEKKVPEVKVDTKPGPAKTLETMRKEGQQEADLTIVMPRETPSRIVEPAKGKSRAVQSFDDKNELFKYIDLGGGIGAKGKKLYHLATQKELGTFRSPKAAKQAATTLKESGIDFLQKDYEKIQQDAKKWIESKGVISVKGETKIADFLTGRGKELELEDYLKVFPKIRSFKGKVEKRAEEISGTLKNFADVVPEFTLNPTFVVEDGYLVFKDRYTFRYLPEKFGLDPEALKEGQTVRFDLESFGIKPATAKALKEAEPFLGKAGFVAVPAALKDIVDITEAAVSPAESRFARLGLTGKKLVARAKRANERAKIRAGRSMELMHRTTKGLTSVEKKNLGYTVNYIAWEKDVRAKREKLRGYKLRAKPSSLKQSKAASTFLKLADYARSEYEKLGGEVKMGGIPWPQRFTKQGLKLYAEAMDAVDKNGEPNFKVLRENALIKAMIEEGMAKDVGQAYKILKRQQDWIKRPLYAYMERNKEPLPSKYLEFDVDKIVDQDFWLKMYRHVEYARQFGVEHYRAAQYIKAIKDEHGEAIANSVQEWWDRLIDLPKQETKGQIVSRKLAFALGQYQALKLSPLTSIQNFFQRWLSAMEWGPIAVLRGQAKAWTRKGRIYARESGAIPFDPFEAGLMADLKTKESRAFARAWVEAIGMGVTERGNNYTAANAAAIGIINDLERLSKKTGPAGNLARNFLSLGGDSISATRRRLRTHGVNWKKALKRGHLTIDELHLVSLREAESKHFRTDFFTTPTWWQRNPWARQWTKYRIPFSYNMMFKIWKLAGIEAVHGNFRPMLAFMLVVTMTGEVYHLWRRILFGEDRSDLPIIKRLWEDWVSGGAIALFGGMVFGKDIVEKIWNTTFGVSGATLKRTVELVGRKIPEAPEHTGEHILRHIEQEIPTVKYINQATWQKEDHIRRFNRYKVREYEEELVKKEGDLWYYYEDLYDAAIEGNRAKMVNAARKAIEHGATLDTLITAMTSRRPAKIAQVKRPELITGLAEPQKEVLRKLEREHDIAVARVRVLAKGRWNEYVAGLIRQASSKKRPLGERQRAMQRLNNIGVSKSQWDKYLREAREDRRK